MRNFWKWLPWLLLGLIGSWCFLFPHKGLIGPIELPRDDAVLSDQAIQWWYWTGHLDAVSQRSGAHRQLGFELVFFAFNDFWVIRDQLTHAAITDVTGNSFHFAEYLHYRFPHSHPERFDFVAGPGDLIRAAGGDGRDHLHSEVDGYVLDLDLAPGNEPVLHYGGSPHPFRFGGYTYYYSRERMPATGTLTIDGEPYTVTGSGWFDRQYGDLNQAINQGWQWFAIELAGNRQLMLYNYRGKNAGVERYGALTEADGTTRQLGPKDLTVTDLGSWSSPHTGCTYPSGWRVEAAGLNLTVQPAVLDQELHNGLDVLMGPRYWEGTATVSGDAAGQAYVELNGYCPRGGQR